MSNRFTKLFSEIVTSSIWSESDKTRIVWITMLALVDDAEGFVPASLPGLANAARVSMEDCAAALDVLEAPDPHSRTPDHDGRRIGKVPGGWLILNYPKFRDRDRQEKRREYMAELMRQRRELLAAKANALLTGANASASVSASVSVSDLKGGCKGGATPPPEPAIIHIPTVGDDSEGYPVTQAEADEWAKLFPKVDVPQTLNEVRAWNLANPTRRKTIRGVPKHIVAWLTKEQNGGGRR